MMNFGYVAFDHVSDFSEGFVLVLICQASSQVADECLVIKDVATIDKIYN